MPLRLRHPEVQRGKEKRARLRVCEHPQGMALMAFAFHAIQAVEIAKRMPKRICRAPCTAEDEASLGKEASVKS